MGHFYNLIKGQNQLEEGAKLTHLVRLLIKQKSYLRRGSFSEILKFFARENDTCVATKRRHKNPPPPSPPPPQEHRSLCPSSQGFLNLSAPGELHILEAHLHTVMQNIPGLSNTQESLGPPP